MELLLLLKETLSAKSLWPAILSKTIFANSINLLLEKLKILRLTLSLSSENTIAYLMLTSANGATLMNPILIVAASTQPTSILGKDTLKLSTEKFLAAEIVTDTTTTSRSLHALISKENSPYHWSEWRSSGLEFLNHVEEHMFTLPPFVTAADRYYFYFLIIWYQKSE